MNPTSRRTVVLNDVETRGSVSVAYLAHRLRVPEMTIRRDLIDLEKEGLVRRVPGGAVNSRGRSFEPSLLLRAGAHGDSKECIGAQAAQLVEDGDRLALDVGTTPLEAARHLLGRRNLTIITPSLNIATLLLNQPDMRLILPGGIVRPGEFSLGVIVHIACEKNA